MTTGVAIVMGSDSDLPHLEGCIQTLSDFGIPHEVRVLSAHRTPELARKYALEAKERGLGVLIAAAGGAAHLAGALAANTTIPVIGVPISATPLNGMDALLATVQMPPGIPVATMAIGKMGGTNAALFAIQILALGDAKLAERMNKHRNDMAEKVSKKDRDVSNRYGGIV